MVRSDKSVEFSVAEVRTLEEVLTLGAKCLFQNAQLNVSERLTGAAELVRLKMNKVVGGQKETNLTFTEVRKK